MFTVDVKNNNKKYYKGEEPTVDAVGKVFGFLCFSRVSVVALCLL